MKKCEVCGVAFTKRRPNSCQPCYFKKRHKERYKKKLRTCISCGKLELLGHSVYCSECRDEIKCCSDAHRVYFGRKFYKAKNGYWVCCRSGLPWAHRWVWINNFKEIPQGFDIHHIDGNKDNNNIENLEKITRQEHQRKHWQQGDHEHEVENRKRVLAQYRKTKG